MSFGKKLSDFDPYFKDQGIDYPMGAKGAGQVSVGFLVTSGGSPDSVVFADLGLPDMADATYAVLTGGETSATVDESTKAATGFDLIGGVAAEVINVLVVGRVAGAPEV